MRNKGRGKIMSTALRMRSLFVLLIVCLCTSYRAFAQTETATLSGVIQDPNGGVVPGVEVTATRIETGTAVTTKTNGAGIYFFTGLTPGRYHVIVRKPGFKEIAIKDFELFVQDKLEQNFSLEIGSVSETVTVEAGAPLVNTTDGSVGTVVDRKYVENMPLNGRSFQDLILLTPGVVTTTPQIGPSAVGGAGEFSVNGQRTESNYYTVDGVSANVSINANGASVPGTSGSLPASTALGTTQGLVSLDALEQFRTQTSTYSAEYGRNPGAQFSFVTRSGSNQWHGSAFDYLRNDVFDAKDWFNNFFGKPKPAERQNDFGGTVGGPIEIPGVYKGKDKTFFFFSYEGLRLVQPQAARSVDVPDASLRATTPAPLQNVLNAFPVPNCTTTPNCITPGNGVAEFVGTWSNPSGLDSTSIRLDHSISERLRLFFRFSNTSSNVDAHNPSTPSVLDSSAFTTRTYTLGATSSFSSKLSNELRLNYTSNETTQSGTPVNFGGSQAANLFQLQGFSGRARPAPFVDVGLILSGHFMSFGQFGSAGEQKQWNLVETLGLSLGRHQLKFGFDFRRLDPSVFQFSPFVNYFYFSSTSVQANSVDFGSASSFGPAFPFYTNFSAFAQDGWRITPRLSVSMGLRWEVNPAPGSTKGKNNLPYTVQGNSLSTLTLAPQGTPLWKTSWYNFAPRLGAAYIIRNAPQWETVVRAGSGVFFDTGQQLGSFGYSGPGFSAQTLFGSLFGSAASFPLPPAQVNPAIVNPPVPPFNVPVFAFPTHPQLPFTLQWNASVEQSFGKSQALTVSYVGAKGRRLLERNAVVASSFNPNFGTVDFIRNALTSDYDALQVQFQRRLAKGLQALASYTWGHSIDFGSQDASLPFIRGNSDYDVRHSFSGALSYDLPGSFQSRFARAVLQHWGLDGRFTARTGFPVTLQGNPTIDPATGRAFFGGLDLVPGKPIYIFGSACTAVYGTQCPGGRAINPNAFSPPSGSNSGDAPRNFTRGFGAWQMDLAVRQDFPIRENLKLQFRAEAFNVFNHPNFGTINANFCTAGPGCTFGQATATLSQSLGVLSPLYQMGSPRSMQFALKLVF